MKILVIDIETTGFLNTGGKIVEVGIVELNLSNGKTKILFDKVTHERPITRQEVENSWIVKNSSITVEEIRKSKELKHYIPEIQEIINSCKGGATAYNNAFDFGFLTNRGIKINHILPDPMLILTDIIKLPPRIAGTKYKYPKVEESWQYLFPDEPYKELHRGADDALHEAKIIYELFKMGMFRYKFETKNLYK